MIRIYSDGPIRKSEPMTQLRVDGHPDFQLYRIPSLVWEDAWDGYAIDLRGDQVPTFEAAAPAAWQFSEGDDALVIALYRAFAYIPGSPLIATLEVDRRAAPDKQVRGYLELSTDREWSSDDLLAAGKALRLLQGVVQTSGRHRIGANEDDGELALARNAERLKRENPTWTWLRIVHTIGLVDAIEDEGRSRNPEAAALERLRRWRNRLRALGE